jgi:hypothetical protein
MIPRMGCQRDLGFILSSIAKEYLVVLHTCGRYRLIMAYRMYQLGKYGVHCDLLYAFSGRGMGHNDYTIHISVGALAYGCSSCVYITAQ